MIIIFDTFFELVECIQRNSNKKEIKKLNGENIDMKIDFDIINDNSSFEFGAKRKKSLNSPMEKK